MRADQSRLADTVQSVSGFAFLVGLLLIALPLVLPPESTAAFFTEIAGGLAAMALGAWGAWQGRLAHTRLAIGPGLGLVTVALALALLALVVPLASTHVAVLAVLAVTLFLTGIVDATWAARAGRGARFTRRA